ncbi:MAG: hypothetical protein ACFBSC_15205 [Microcoleaceae cyanobacterium]
MNRISFDVEDSFWLNDPESMATIIHNCSKHNCNKQGHQGIDMNLPDLEPVLFDRIFSQPRGLSVQIEQLRTALREAVESFWMQFR